MMVAAFPIAASVFLMTQKTSCFPQSVVSSLHSYSATVAQKHALHLRMKDLRTFAFLLEQETSLQQTFVSSNASIGEKDREKMFPLQQSTSIKTRSHALHGAPPPFNEASKKIYLKRATHDGGLTLKQVRLALRDAGVTMSFKDVELILEEYDCGSSGMITLAEFNLLTSKLTRAKFWLSVDPSGHTRKVFQNGRKMFVAGLASTARKIHTLTGVSSLIVGTFDLARILEFGITHTISTELFIQVASVHSLCAAASLFLVEWDGFPLQGHQAARRNQMVVAGILPLHALGVFLSEYGSLPSEKPLILIHSVSFQCFAWSGVAMAVFVLFFSAYEGGKKNEKSGLPEDSRMGNIVAVGVPMALVFTPDLCSIKFALDETSLQAYINLCQQYPCFISEQRNFLTLVLFFNNLLALLATALRYNILSQKQVTILNRLICLVLVFGPIYGIVILGNDFARQLLDVIFN